MHDGQQSLSEFPVCSKKNRCRKWRICRSCALIRQAKIADLAEKLASMYPALRYSVIEPSKSGQAALAAARAAWGRLHAPPLALWTVEYSKATSNLHLNILHPADAERKSSLFRTWTTEVSGNPRAIGAYIGKPDQAPPQELYPGRTSGTLGPLWKFLANENQAPPLAAAALQHALDPERLARAPASPAPSQENPQVPENLDYRSIAARWLPDILSKRVHF